MNRMACCLLALSLVFVLPAAAQVYKYEDANGDIRFTDDITVVPEGQRSQYMETAPAGEPAEEPSPEGGEEDAGIAEQPAGQEDNLPAGAEEGRQNPDSDQATIDRLNAEQQKLKQEYDALNKEKRALEKERKEVRTSAQLKAYNDKADALNKKIDDYEQRARAFAAKRDAFNSRGENAPPESGAE